MYISKRVDRRSFNEPDRWKFEATHVNPADECTRGVLSKDIEESALLKKTEYVLHQEEGNTDSVLSTGTLCLQVLNSTSLLEYEVQAIVGNYKYERFTSWDRFVDKHCCTNTRKQINY